MLEKKRSSCFGLKNEFLKLVRTFSINSTRLIINLVAVSSKPILVQNLKLV